MMVSTSILSALVNVDAIVAGEKVMQSSAAVVDQQDGIFQELLRASGKGDKIQTLTDGATQSPVVAERLGVQGKREELFYPASSLSLLRAVAAPELEEAMPTREDRVTVGVPTFARLSEEWSALGSSLLAPHSGFSKMRSPAIIPSQEILSAFSLLPVMGMIPSYHEGVYFEDNSVLATAETPSGTSSNEEPLDPSVTAFSNQEHVIQTILANAYPSYVGQVTTDSKGADFEGSPTPGTNYSNSNTSVLDDSDLDTLIASLLLSKRKDDTSAASLADLNWNHFNEAILTDADQGDSGLTGFTFEGEDVVLDTAIRSRYDKGAGAVDALPVQLDSAPLQTDDLTLIPRAIKTEESNPLNPPSPVEGTSRVDDVFPAPLLRGNSPKVDTAIRSRYDKGAGAVDALPVQLDSAPLQTDDLTLIPRAI
ncbi:MAG: hypothetical protein HY201_02500, partial [Nitrospirae bacterium]|nr:hypothetical protein [Candidatus Troglogloeales bacterium]